VRTGRAKAGKLPRWSRFCYVLLLSVTAETFPATGYPPRAAALCGPNTASVTGRPGSSCAYA